MQLVWTQWKVFFNLEKNLGNQHQICKLIFDEKEIDKDVEILNKIRSFYEILFKNVCVITTPSLNNDQISICEKDLSETDSCNAMENMKIINILETMG